MSAGGGFCRALGTDDHESVPYEKRGGILVGLEKGRLGFHGAELAAEGFCDAAGVAAVEAVCLDADAAAAGKGEDGEATGTEEAETLDPRVLPLGGG